ncbi:MAG: branched-chain amino acid transport system substrate-binding protein [Cognaticolwellia sp.]|jgi:branched-chain amino acid transport system substrate-binding protein
MHRSFLLLLLALSPALAAPGLFKGNTPTLSAPSIVTQARALSATDRLEAIAVLEAYLDQGKDEELMALVTLEAGEQRRLNGDLDDARAHFQAVTKRWPEHPAKDAALLGMALVAYDSGHASGNSMATLRMVPDELATQTMNADRYRILALEAEQEGAAEGELQLLVEQAYGSAADDPEVLARVDRSLAHMIPEDQRVEVDQPASDTSDAADEATLQRAQGALRAGDMAQAKRHAQELVELYPESDHLRAAEWVVMRAEANNPYNPKTVGVLLPLSGKYAPAGKQLRDTLEMGFEGTGTELVVLDTGGTGDGAKAMFKELVLKHGAAAIIGPLTQEEAYPAVAEAQASGVPLVSLSQAPDQTETGNWIFQTALTPEHQVRGLLKEMMDERVARRFAVMAPDTPYGRAAKDTFVEQVMQRGGTVETVVFYDPTQKDFRADARKLPESQPFDAIFIPDSHSRVAMIASALAYEEYAIGSFSPGKGHTPVPLIGLNGWHNERLALTGGKYVERCVFVDAFYDKDPAVGDFVRLYENRFNRTPGVLDATAYDTAKLVSVAVATQAVDRGAFRAALNGAALSSPTSGGNQFDENREVERSLHAFTIENGEMRRIGELSAPLE